MSSPELRFAVLGAGFWARYQFAAWRELGPGAVRCVAVCDPAREKAQALVAAFGGDEIAVFEDAEALFAAVEFDFVDVITPVETHAELVRMAAARGLPVICQKPMGRSLAEAEAMVAACRAAGVSFFVHENWRWQTPLRALAAVLRENRIGRPFRARLQFSNSFPVFDNQPFLATQEQFLLTDIGSHVLDAARFLFGEARTLFCHTRRIHPRIRGEDVATVMMTMGPGNAAPDELTTVVCEMSYASRWEHERFPETFALVEGKRGAAALGPDYRLSVTTEDGTWSRRCPPPRYAWADPAYDLVQASSVACNANLLRALRSGAAPETHADDNLETVRLVFAAYESARTGRSVDVPAFSGDRT